LFLNTFPYFQSGRERIRGRP